jgi:tetratricopeptide (TPR) repeat protein
MNPVKKIAGLLKGKKLFVFCGAGISFNSGLPLANDLVSVVFDHLKLSSSEKEIMWQAKLPFETIAGTLADEASSLGFLDMYRGGQPSQAHHFLAGLAKKGFIKLIVTTNFDTLIEQALELAGLSKMDYEFYTDEMTFGKIDWATPKLILVKIHGSIDAKGQMAVTLKKISQAPLTLGRKEVIDRMFGPGCEGVLVFGYSFSDVFDLSPQIAALPANKIPIFIIAHQTGIVKPLVRRAALDTRLPFLHFANAKVIEIDTNLFISAVATACLNRAMPVAKPNANDWKSITARWFSKMGEMNATLLDSTAGRLFYLAGNFPLSLEKYQQALSKTGNPEQSCEQWANLGIVKKELGDYDDAIDSLLKAKALSMNLKGKHHQISVLNNLAYTYGAKGDHGTQLELQQASLAMAIKAKNKELTAINYNNLGISFGALKRYDEAENCFNRSFALMESLGFIQWKARTINNMGIVRRKQGQLTQSLELHEEARLLAVKLGFTDEECLAYQNKGRAYLALKNYPQAIVEAKRSMEIAKSSRKKDTYLKCLRLLVDIYSAAKQPRLANRYRRMAEDIKEFSF